MFLQKHKTLWKYLFFSLALLAAMTLFILYAIALPGWIRYINEGPDPELDYGFFMQAIINFVIKILDLVKSFIIICISCIGMKIVHDHSKPKKEIICFALILLLINFANLISILIWLIFWKLETQDPLFIEQFIIAVIDIIGTISAVACLIFKVNKEKQIKIAGIISCLCIMAVYFDFIYSTIETIKMGFYDIFIFIAIRTVMFFATVFGIIVALGFGPTSYNFLIKKNVENVVEISSLQIDVSLNEEKNESSQEVDEPIQEKIFESKKSQIEDILNNIDPVERLKELKNLLDNGIIDEAEYKKSRSKYVDKL